MIFPGALLLHHTITTVHQGIAQTLSVLENGTIIEQGTHNELLANKNGLYKTLTELQFAV